MRSRAARLTLSAAILVAFVGAGALIAHSERLVTAERARLRAIDREIAGAAEALGRRRAAQQAYVAEGQGPGYWFPEVTRLIETIKAGVEGLRESVRDPEAVPAVESAASTVTGLDEIDRRAREYLKSGQLLMTADVVFAEGGDAAATAQRHLQNAGLAEQHAFDAFEARTRRIRRRA
jgi:hypothetical protein